MGKAASPVAWIADEVWASWEPRPPGEGGDPPIEEPQPMAATEDDRARAPVLPPGRAPAPPAADVATAGTLLAGTPPATFGIRAPVWPLCCGRPATLINAQGLGVSLSAIEACTGPLDRAYLEAELRTGWGARSPAELARVLATGFRDALAGLRARGLADGLALYHCRACGRVYVASCHP